MNTSYEVTSVEKTNVFDATRLEKNEVLRCGEYRRDETSEGRRPSQRW